MIRSKKKVKVNEKEEDEEEENGNKDGEKKEPKPKPPKDLTPIFAPWQTIDKSETETIYHHEETEEDRNAEEEIYEEENDEEDEDDYYSDQDIDFEKKTPPIINVDIVDKDKEESGEPVVFLKRVREGAQNKRNFRRKAL